MQFSIDFCILWRYQAYFYDISFLNSDHPIVFSIEIIWSIEIILDNGTTGFFLLASLLLHVVSLLRILPMCQVASRRPVDNSPFVSVLDFFLRIYIHAYTQCPSGAILRKMGKSEEIDKRFILKNYEFLKSFEISHTLAAFSRENSFATVVRFFNIGPCLQFFMDLNV